jgi:outer membrane protein TolC
MPVLLSNPMSLDAPTPSLTVRRLAAIGLLLGGLLMSACQSPLAPAPPRGGMGEHQRPATVETRIDQSQQPGATAQTSTDALASGDGPQPYVSVAMQNNPAIRAAKRQVQRFAARVPQATSLADPTLQVAPFGEMAETAAGQNAVMASVSQKLPLPEKLAKRGAIAEQDIAMARQQLRQTRLRIAGEVRRAYWDYYLAVRSLEVTEANQRLLRQLQRTAKAKYQAGTASQADVLRASTALSDLKNRRSTLRQRKRSSAAMLNRLMDRPLRQSLPEPGKASFDRPSFDLDQLLHQARANNPQIIERRRRIDQFRAKRRLANLNRWPDLTVSANYTVVEDEGLSPVATGEDAWWLGFGLNIPIWQAKLDAAEREALQGRLEAAADLETIHNTIAYRVQDALGRFRTQQAQVTLFEETLLPQAEQAVDASISSYRAGAGDFVSVIDNWEKLLQFELAYHKAIAQLQQDLADLQQQVGAPLPRHHQPATTRPASQPRTHPTDNVDPEMHDE